MANQKSGPGAPPAAPPPAPRAEYGGQKLDPTPPADHADFLQARAPGLSAIRSRLASRRKKA